MNTLSNERLEQLAVEEDMYNFCPEHEELNALARELLALRKEREAAVPIRYMNRYTGACYTLEQQPDAATDTAVYVPLYDVAQPVAVPELFVQGVIDDGENCAYADDDEAQYFTVYRRNADGTADALMDFTNRVNALWAISLVKKLNKQAESNS